METFKSEDIYRLASLSDLRAAPEDQTLAFCESGMDPDKNEYTSRVLTISFGGETEPQAVTDGTARESKPRWSPDGRRVAYVAHPNETGAVIVSHSLDEGTAETLTQTPEDIDELEWSPDGRWIAFTSRERDEEMYGPEKPKDQAPKKIDHLIYRLDNVGWTVGRTKQLFIVSAEGGAPRVLTSMPTDVGGIAWAPDSRTIVTSSADHPTWDRDHRTDLFAVQVEKGSIERLTANDGSYAEPSFDHDGSRLAFYFSPEPIDGPYHDQVAVMDMASRMVEVLTQDLDRNCAPYGMHREPIWAGNDLYFGVEDSGNVHVYKIDLDGDRKPKLVIGEDRSISSFEPVGTGLAMVVTAPDTVSKLALAQLDESSEEVVYDPCKSLQASTQLVMPERFAAVSTDGSEVEAWIMTPPNFDPSRKYPMLLNIHGGPFTQYGNKFFDEFQVYASAGYVVVYSNPRGSCGYAESWGRAIKGPKTKHPGTGWGSIDFDDLMAVTDEAVARYPFIDPERLGVMGGSYGGYMTSWIIGHTDRFKAAISERAVNSMFTMAYTSDIAAYFSVKLGPLYIDDPAEYLRLSPITYVADIRTPVLILHSENDLRCPIEQAEQLFMALKQLGRDVEFIRFPGESHELSRSGAPRHRAQRFEAILDYLSRKL